MFIYPHTYNQELLWPSLDAKGGRLGSRVSVRVLNYACFCNSGKRTPHAEDMRTEALLLCGKAHLQLGNQLELQLEQLQLASSWSCN